MDTRERWVGSGGGRGGFCLHTERGERGEGSPARALSDTTTTTKKKKGGGGGRAKKKERWGRGGGSEEQKVEEGRKGAPKQEKPGASNYSAIC